MAKHSFAYLGMGVMGTPMAVNLAHAGFAVTVWNRTQGRPGVQKAQQAGCRVALSLKNAVADADVIFTCLSDVPDVKSVLLGEGGVINHAKTNSLVIDMSTIGPDAAHEISTSLEACGLRFLDAPVTGGDVGAQNGTLTIMVGGKEADLEEARPALNIMGKNVYHCGPVGSGQNIKMINQQLCAVHVIALCEALASAQDLNLDPTLVVNICGTGAAGSWALTNLGPRINSSDFSPGFKVRHMCKDLRLLKESLHPQDQPLPGTDLAEKLFLKTKCLDDGQGADMGAQAMFLIYNQT